ncbi:hypothetical protein FEP90_05725 [Burkholderia multivorans]|nr:hypothetical protein [Burkholderia multivorans]MDR8769636.1 hypothetical protein [Burkholderia multivorans]MDR8790738.1 hypothetical protein [Burkholderia multivorans]MDR8799292.1 hypothetical protein [Burkholderia multivorans]MDR8816305.1 hypothetical protein [Burkholderia multivorans]
MAPCALVVAFDRFTSPAVAFSDRLPFVAVRLPARFTLPPVSDAWPPATFWPVAVSWPDAVRFRSPPCVTEPSLFTPAPSVPVELTLPALTVVFCFAASVPLFVRSAAVLADSDCCA